MFSKGGHKIHKVPGNESEALKTSLISIWDMKKLSNFYKYLDKVEEENPMTWGKLDLKKQPMKDVYAEFKISESSQDFLGHALALHRDDNYLNEPAINTIKKMGLYLESVGKYGDSPFLYPVYGLGGIPESFSRLCAIHGGTYMLNQDIDEILFEDGKVTGVKSGEDVAKAPIVVCDPSYVKKLEKTKVTGKVVRAICILDHAIPNTADAESVQIILPQKQLKRNSDIYITCVSSTHAVCAQGLKIAIISATVETDDPEKEIAPAVDLLGGSLEMFVSVSEIQEPTHDAKAEQLFVTKSYDATSHFESSSLDVIALYEQITGETLDLNIQPSEDDEDY